MTKPEMSTSVREELSADKFGLAYPDPDVFVRSQWRLPRLGYLIWRLFWCLWHVGWCIASGVDTSENRTRSPEEGAKWFIYLSHWTLLLTAFTCTVDFLVVLYVTVKGVDSVLELSNTSRSLNAVEDRSGSGASREREEVIFHGEFTLVDGLKQHTTTWYLKLLWLLYNIINSSNIVVTIAEWAMVYSGSTHVVDVEIHVVNTVFILVNLMVTSMPVQLLHFIYPVAYLALYFLFTLIYYAAGGTDIRGRDVIYTALDWSKAYPTAVIVTLGVLLAIPVAHVLVFAVFTFRVFLYAKLNSASYSTGHLAGDNLPTSSPEVYGASKVSSGSSVHTDGSHETSFTMERSTVAKPT